MLGVIVNTLTVIVGSLIGLIFRKGLPKKITDAVMLGIGLCTIYIAVSGLIKGENALIAIISTALGAVIGALLDLDRLLEKLGEAVTSRFKRGDGEGGVAQGFVTASLLFCCGAMTIVGSINSGLTGDNQMIFTKSTLDLVSSMMLSATLGIGVLLSSVFVFVFQGALVLSSGLLAPILNEAVIAEVTCVGSILILALGLNIIGVTKIKVANYLPAIFLVPLVAKIFELIAA